MDMTIIAPGYRPRFRLAVCLRKCYKLLRSLFVSKWEDRAKTLIAAYDNPVQSSLEEVMEEDRMVRGAGPTPSSSVANRVRRRYRPQNAHVMAFALADEAYLKFGHRVRDAASLEITRKFMLDLLTANPDLRAKDAATIIDLALYPSFLPSQALRMMNAIDSTSAFDKRSRTSAWDSWWWRASVRRYQA